MTPEQPLWKRVELTRPTTVLVVDDEPSACKVLGRFLQGRGYQVSEAHDGIRALELYHKERHDVVLLDVRIPGMDGLEVLGAIQRECPEAVVIMTTAVNQVSTAVEAMKRGAYDYLIKPIQLDQLHGALERAKERIALLRELERLRALQKELLAEEAVVVASPAMERVFELATMLGRADRATVLIMGETGTGKEIVARAIHRASPRAEQPMVVVNCGAIPKELMEAELLGYAKGAFTGAAKEGKKGKVELAHGGTLFLDEVGELPHQAQTVLLRILDGHPFYPVGSNREVQVDVRIIAATNRDLEAAVSEGTFREDLFYRLNVAPLSLPPLRERPEEILPMALAFLKEFNQRYGKSFRGISREAASILQSYPWRGNVRELKNAIERVVLYESGKEVLPSHLSFLGGSPSQTREGFVLPEEGVDLEALVKDLILQALEKARGNKSKAARLLGISRPTLLYRMDKYGLKDK
jgi:DNA-binding NtrC family response regulator